MLGRRIEILSTWIKLIVEINLPGFCAKAPGLSNNSATGQPELAYYLHNLFGLDPSLLPKALLRTASEDEAFVWLGTIDHRRL